MEKIGFIGTGVMGTGMVKNLLKKGYSVKVYNRTQEKAQDVLNAGAEWAASPAEAAKEADVVITIVGYPADVEEVYLGKNGLLETAAEGTYLVDMTTSSPTLAKKIGTEGRKRGLYVFDAPVSGGDVGAREGRLSIMVGGPAEKFPEIVPVLEAMGSKIVLQGESGSGQYTKMCNQIVIASNMMGVCEALVYGEKAGLDMETVMESIGGGAAASFSLNNLGPRILKGDFEPGFYIRHFIKDMTIALESAEEMGLALPALKLSLERYRRLADAGHDCDGTQALYLEYDEKGKM